jgi:hypothetical protein
VLLLEHLSLQLLGKLGLELQQRACASLELHLSELQVQRQILLPFRYLL